MVENEEEKTGDGSLYSFHVARFVTGLLHKRRRPTNTNRFGKTGQVPSGLQVYESGVQAKSSQCVFVTLR